MFVTDNIYEIDGQENPGMSAKENEGDGVKLPPIKRGFAFSYSSAVDYSGHKQMRGPILPALTSSSKWPRRTSRRRRGKNVVPMMSVKPCTFHEKLNKAEPNMICVRTIVHSWERAATMKYQVDLNDDIEEEHATPPPSIKTTESLEDVLIRIPDNHKRWKKKFTKTWVNNGVDSDMKYYEKDPS